MEVGFKWQLLTLDKERKWIPSTALITSIYAPTGGTSVLGSHTVEPYINLIYGWSVTDKLTLGGSTGYLGMRVTDLGPGRPADSFQRCHQSLLAFYSVNKRTTLFYEWYVWMFTNAADNRPTHYMDGGILYLLTPNMQLDLRAGFGLSGRPDDFFTGAGYSVRFEAARRRSLRGLPDDGLVVGRSRERCPTAEAWKRREMLLAWPGRAGQPCWTGASAAWRAISERRRPRRSRLRYRRDRTRRTAGRRSSRPSPCAPSEAA